MHTATAVSPCSEPLAHTCLGLDRWVSVPLRWHSGVVCQLSAMGAFGSGISSAQRVSQLLFNLATCNRISNIDFNGVQRPHVFECAQLCCCFERSAQNATATHGICSVTLSAQNGPPANFPHNTFLISIKHFGLKHGRSLFSFLCILIPN